MTDWIALHALMARGRAQDALVGHDGSTWVRWREFASRVGAYAAVLAQRTEQRWLLVSAQPLEFAAQWLGLLHADKHVVIPPNTQSGTLELLRGQYDAVVVDLPEVSHQDHRPLPQLDPARALVDLYTSGSTAAPKPVRKNLRQFESELNALEAQWGSLLGSCAVFGTAPHHHLYGLTFRVLWPLSAGRPTDNVTCSHPGMLVQRLNVFKGGILVSSPAQLSRWPDLGSLSALPSRPRMILSSGGPLSASAAAAFRHELGAAPTEIYGSTETGVIAWRCQEVDDLWNPISGVSVSIDHEEALVIHSPFLEGDGFWRMDDAVDLKSDGRFSLKGRLDRTVKIEEKRLFLPDMEEQLASHPAVASAAVVPLTGARQMLGAVVVLSDDGREQLLTTGRRALTESLRQHLLHYFDRVLLPRRWRFPDQLPFNERGKLTAAALMALFADEA